VIADILEGAAALVALVAACALLLAGVYAVSNVVDRSAPPRERTR
jgi:hypothetical protein